MHNLSIDLETFSSEPIAKTGLYKYVQSRDFQVLLFAYSLDNAPVQVLDLTREELPEWLKAALYDPAYIKHAFNAAFEWYALSKHFGRELPLEQWRCTMLHSLYCGYPASLDAAGKALGLPQDKQKLTTGKALIKYFCTPCAKTITNGGRTRNLPEHDPAKWELFVEYNRQDVVTEMEIERRLSRFPVPERVQREWEYDMRISARGVAADRELVDGALYCGTAIEEAAKQEAIELTGLENPKSREQMLTWLQGHGVAIPDLRSATVEDALEHKDEFEPDVARVLELRQLLSKASIKKYSTVVTTMCEDGRIRGLLQFYGANRTGRWAGRLVQVQNLPRTYLHGAMLDTARNLTRRKLPEGLELLYGSVPGTLSQLVRTALVPRPGCKFVDADFSAIEARVVAWLAGEEWVLQVFRTHGKIYEATASQMFGVPLDRIVKGNPEYALRQKGKVATLALGYQGSSPALINMGALRSGLMVQRRPKDSKYCAQMDVRKFYDSIPPDGVRRALERKIKDKRFVRLVTRIIADGLAIGYYICQWIANYYLETLDRTLCACKGVVCEVRYMDNVTIFGRSKRALHKAVKAAEQHLQTLGLTLKNDWQVYPIRKRKVDAVGYKFGRNAVVLRKRSLLRTLRQFRRAAKRERVSAKMAQALLSRLGRLKWCASKTIMVKYVRPVGVQNLKGVVRIESARRCQTA